MTIDVHEIPRPGWDPLPESVGVVGRVLVRAEGWFVAELRFAEHATINEHPGVNDAIVTCLQGEGFTSVGSETVPIQEEQQVTWPKDVPHRLWTEASTMTTLMVERLSISRLG
jgi:quercetin dioxygenase-like cupin family protein